MHCTSESPAHEGSSSPQCQAPYLVAVIIVRTGSEERLRAALSSLTGHAGAYLVVPEHGASLGSSPQQDDSSPGSTCPEGMERLPHNITWHDSKSVAKNRALEVAQAAGEDV